MIVAVRALRARPRLALSAGVALALALLLPARFSLVSRLLLAWDTGAVLYLALTLSMMACSDVGGMRRRAATQDEGAMFILFVTSAATVASLAAIAIELHGSRARSRRASSFG
jgi:uncharacterized membrane protein